MGRTGALGIIHPEVVAVESWFEPMKVGGYLTGDDIRLACVDVHMSHEMMIGLDGTFFSRRELSSSYFHVGGTVGILVGLLDDPPVAPAPVRRRQLGGVAVLATRLARFRIDDLSDQYAQVYGTERFVVGIGDNGQQCDVLVAEGERTPEFADLVLDQPPEPTSRAEPGAAADGEGM